MAPDCARDAGGPHLGRYRRRGHNRTPPREPDLFVPDEKFDFHFCVQVADPISRRGSAGALLCRPEFLVFSASLSPPDRFLLAGASRFLLSVCLRAAAGGKGKEEEKGKGKEG